MDEVSSGSEHPFTGQRTCFEGAEIVVEYIRDVVNEFLR
jgi:hypothetical protein